MLWRSRLAVAAVLLLAAPFVWSAGRREVARWYHAAALQDVYLRDRAAALDKIDRALAWDPESLPVLLRRGELYLALRRTGEAVEVAERALAVARDRFARRPSRERAEQLIQALNLNAYAHALDGSEIESALERVGEAFQLAGTEDIAGILDTRGYLHYLAGDDDRALRDLERAVALEQSNYKLLQARFREEARAHTDQLPFEHQVRSLDEVMAVLYHHRGLVCERLGRVEAAEKDFRRALSLGYDPSQGVW